MSLGLQNNGPNSYRQYALFSSLRVWSTHTSRDTNVITHVALATKMTEGDNDRLCLQELKALDEKRLQAQQHIDLCQARILKAFNKKVMERVFQKGDLVLIVRWPMVMTHKTKGKFQPKLEASFMVETVYLNGAYRLANPNGDTLVMPMNVLEEVLFLIMLTPYLWSKKYYTWPR